MCVIYCVKGNYFVSTQLHRLLGKITFFDRNIF